MSAQNRKLAGLDGQVRARALVVVSETFADGGIQRFNRTFLTACDDLGISCDVLSLGDSVNAQSRWSGPKLANISVYGHNRLRFALAAAAKILCGDFDFIIVGHINLLGLVVAATRLRPRARRFLIAHGVEVWTGLTGSRRVALRKIDSILCVSRYTQRSIQNQVPELPDERFVIFPNALSESWRKQQKPATELELTQRLPDKFLLSVTRLDRAERYKGVITVLEALPMIEDSSVHYVVAGNGNDVEFITRVAERLGIGARVHFVGSVTDAQLAALYRKCLAFVLPSGKEGFGIVFLEAMFFGACVIAANEKGAVDVVQHERTGLLVPYGDCAGLKSAIDRIICDSALRRRIAAAGRATVIGDGAFTFRSYGIRLAQVLNVPTPPSIAALDCASDSQVATPLDESCV